MILVFQRIGFRIPSVIFLTVKLVANVIPGACLDFLRSDVEKTEIWGNVVKPRKGFSYSEK